MAPLWALAAIVAEQISTMPAKKAFVAPVAKPRRFPLRKNCDAFKVSSKTQRYFSILNPKRQEELLDWVPPRGALIRVLPPANPPLREVSASEMICREAGHR